MPKASVLPVPVLAWPMMSLPRSVIGSASAWIGNVVWIPWSSSAAQMSSITLSSRNPMAAGSAAGPSGSAVWFCWVSVLSWLASAVMFC
jgi:hypothetical protein